ncbi:MAG TPA: DMT family transporter [Actinomycetota bacterium]|nr:DMT family transporter [Actinomycetota bacterium]
MSRRRVIVLLVVGVTAVSTSAVLVRLADAPGLAVAFYRCLFASLLLVPWALLRHRGALAVLSRRERWLLVASGLALAGHFASWIPAIGLTSVAASVVLVQTTPVWVVIIGPAFGERASRGAVAGIVVALAGTAIIVAGDLGGGTDVLLGDLLALVGALFAAIYILLGRRIRQRVPVVPYTATVYSIAAGGLALLMLVAGTPFTGYSTRQWGLFLAMTLGPQLLGHTVFNLLLGQVSATVVSVALLAEPVGATVLAAMFLDEAPGIQTVIGGLVVLAGVFLAIRAEARTAGEFATAPVE